MASSLPSARAPPIVAIAIARWAGAAVASRAIALATRLAVRISWIMSRSLLLAAPSVPSATLTPAASSFATGQKPLASFRLDSGQCTTCAPHSASRPISPSSSAVMCTAMSRGDTSPSRSRRANGRTSPRASASSTSPAVSCRWMWIGTSSSSARVRMRSSGPSDTVYGACGANAVSTRGWERNSSWISVARDRYSPASFAHAEGKSSTIMPSTQRMPAAAATCPASPG